MQHFAYIDPGTGSFILQTIVATGLGAVYVVRNHIKQFFNRFRKGSSSEKSSKE